MMLFGALKTDVAVACMAVWLGARLGLSSIGPTLVWQPVFAGLCCAPLRKIVWMYFGCSVKSYSAKLIHLNFLPLGCKLVIFD